MKKIAFIVEKFVDVPVGGEPAIHSNLIQYLASRKEEYEVHVYYEKNAHPLENTPYKKFENFSQNQEEYIKNLNKRNYDLIISSRFGLKFLNLNADIYTIHSHSDLYSQKTKFGILYNILKPRKKRIQKEKEALTKNKDKCFVFCSKQLKQDYNNICEIKDSNVINPYPNFACTNEQTKKERQDKTFTFGISALGFQNKGGYLLLISAFLLKFINNDFKLKIIYKIKPSFLPSILLTLTGLKKRTELFDRQQDMKAFFESIDCLVMASQLESFGMTAIEAMTYNLPVIVSSNCGVRELIKNGENGHIFKYDCFKEINLTQKMKNVLENKNKIYFNNIKLDKEKYNETFSQIINKKLICK